MKSSKLIDAYIKFKQKYGKGYKGTEIGPCFIISPNGKKIKIDDAYFYNVGSFFVEYNEYYMGHQYTKRVNENLTIEQCAERIKNKNSYDIKKYHFAHNSASDWVVKDIIIDGKSRLKKFKKILGKENAGIEGNEYNLFNFKYSILKRLKIGDKIKFIIADTLVGDTKPYEYTIDSHNITITQLLSKISRDFVSNII